MVRLAEPSNVPDPTASPIRVINLLFANLVELEAFPIKEPVITPASKLPSASLKTSVLGELSVAISGVT